MIEEAYPSQVDTLPHDNRDIMTIRINVDNFDEAMEFFTARGFRNALGEQMINTDSSRGALLVAPSGFLINLVKHIRNND